MLFRKVQKVNKIRMNEYKLNSAEFSRFDLSSIARVYSHDSYQGFGLIAVDIKLITQLNVLAMVNHAHSP